MAYKMKNVLEAMAGEIRQGLYLTSEGEWTSRLSEAMKFDTEDSDAIDHICRVVGTDYALYYHTVSGFGNRRWELYSAGNLIARSRKVKVKK